MKPDVGRVAQLRADGDHVVISGDALSADRQARTYFGALLGGTPVDDGWVIRPRGRSIVDLVVQIDRWLNQHGYTANLLGVADAYVERERERRLSFERTSRAARELRAGDAVVNHDAIEETLRQFGWNFEARRLLPHQLTAVRHGLTAINSANFSVPGAGKTASTLAIGTVHMANEYIDCFVVVGPLSCFRPWEFEVAEAAPRLRTVRVRGTADERRRRLRQVASGDVVLVSYASAAADKIPLVELCQRMNVMLIADESHRIKRFSGGTWAPAVRVIAKEARIRVVLSGTPMPQSGLDLFTQLQVMWPGGELTGTRTRYKAEVANSFGQVLDRVTPFISRTPKSDLGLPDPVLEYHHVELSPDESEIYTILEDHLRNLVVAAGPAEADRLASLRRGRYMRLLQAACNPALLSPQEARGAHRHARDQPTLISRIDAYFASRTRPAKFTKALELLDRLGDNDKAVVWSTFIGNLDQFSNAVRRRGGIAVFQVDGRVQVGDYESSVSPVEDVETREQIIASFLSNRGRAILVTNPASCSESVSLHMACHTAIYLDRTYDCAQWLQSIDRIHRLGLPRDATVRIHVLQAVVAGRMTIDALIHNSLFQKEAAMRQLLEGARLAPLGLADDETDAAAGDANDLRALISYLIGEIED